MVYSFNVRNPILRIELSFDGTSFTQQSSRMLRKSIGAASNNEPKQKIVVPENDPGQRIVIKS